MKRRNYCHFTQREHASYQWWATPNRDRKNFWGGGHWANSIFCIEKYHLKSEKNVHIIIVRQHFAISIKSFIKPNLPKIGLR